ncbi:MAG: IS66 family transposase [Bacilli bacterium]
MLLKQIKLLNEQIQFLKKALYGAKSEKSKYTAPDGQCSLFDNDPFFSEPENEEINTTTEYIVSSKKKTPKKRNDSFVEGLEVKEVHHYPEKTHCECCDTAMSDVGNTVVREEAEFVPAKMIRIQHIEHAFECKKCKSDTHKKANISRGQAPKAAIQRSIAGPTVLSKLIYDKYTLFVPLYRQVSEWNRYGLNTNDKNLSNWVIRVNEDWLMIIYEEMKKILLSKGILHIDETYAQIINRSDGKSAQSNAYNWVFRSVEHEGPVITLFHSALTRSRSVLEDFTCTFRGTVICDGYSAYGKLPNIKFANCWAHVRRYWLKASSEHGRKGVRYCDELFRLEREFKHLTPSKRRKARRKYSLPIVEEFFKWIDASPFYGKSALATAADYTLNRVRGLKEFLYDGRIEIDNNPAENAIRPNVIGRKNWLFSFSEAGAKANAVCLSIAETAKANGIDFYKYLVKLFTELPNIQLHEQANILERYMPWSKYIQDSCAK